ncbi:Lipase (class 2) [Streptoalloteichus tenebrarius]|uniref:Lipase (Class 2) n=1 Tax=Streptoalloteichus tenebrarius (strain ATCC 17920 / DSM 40477 / JCM 4838 / CBS 697.72 / NBRC 16177 / NCIMB 11028 / NRRL B-12390 / A12253. 1 / ISP 5477) TaxID=1933 RepID=A0ABT1HLT1_STRSD|nr:alpha/beta fold hydrolase [Streptoalloteichus tenebrarius]MCP2256460.1 Lipase (class 2) [Streptoalloteichus tenebrarius]BFF04811.1 alpha/beta fold hydrolase [Streptoalloteichus tenebrarius]
MTRATARGRRGRLGRLGRLRWTALAAVALTGLLAGTAGADPGPAQDTFPAAFAYAVAHPTADPPGANDFSCRPSAAHPRPVVLVHGTWENRYDNWAGLSGRLKERGYCVFALNYGGAPGEVIQGTGDIPTSAGQLRAYVDQVMAATGASAVDIVGHSQGGMMPRYYINNLGGAAKVGTLVALVATNQGTTLHGLAELGRMFPGIVGPCAACLQQIADSDFLRALNAGGGTRPSVRYVNIATRYDEITTPHTSAFLPPGPNVTNQTLQDFCPSDRTEHVGITYNRPTAQLVLNALDPANARPPAC